MTTSLKTQPIHLRPRERLQQYGVDHLTTEELLVIVLGSGSRHVRVQQLAQHITKKFAHTQKVMLSDLLSIHGIGLAKGCQIIAALELVERLRPRFPDAVLDSVDKVAQVVADLRYSDREQAVGLYLDARMRLIHRELLAVGSLNQAVVTPRDVFTAIKQHPVVYIIFVHNHPSGDVTPSAEDVRLTQQLKEAGAIIGVQLLDHVIMGKTTQYSFRSHGQITE